MATAAVNGTKLYYEAVGDGPTCLVLHGWPGADHTYLRPGLDCLAGQLRLVYYDQRGNGRSDHATVDPFTVEQLADDAHALAAHVGARHVLVFGHHHGAVVAQELALRHPGRVAGLVLVSATPGELGRDESLSDAFDVSPIPPEVEVLQRVPPATDDEWAATMQVLAPYFFHRADGPDPTALLARTRFSADAMKRWMQVAGWWSAVDRLGSLDVPALLLVGRHDVFCPPSEAERISRVMGRATTVVLEESGHLPWLEEHDAFVTAVQDWLVAEGPALAVTPG